MFRCVNEHGLSHINSYRQEQGFDKNAPTNFELIRRFLTMCKKLVQRFGLKKPRARRTVQSAAGKASARKLKDIETPQDMNNIIAAMFTHRVSSSWNEEDWKGFCEDVGLRGYSPESVAQKCKHVMNQIRRDDIVDKSNMALIARFKPLKRRVKLLRLIHECLYHSQRDVLLRSLPPSEKTPGWWIPVKHDLELMHVVNVRVAL